VWDLAGASELREVQEAESIMANGDEKQRDNINIGAGRKGELAVWGLSAWYLSLLMRALKVC